VLYTLMNRLDVDSVVNAADTGREGQLIFQILYNYCKCDKPEERLWISSMEESAIREGFGNLRPDAEFDGLYRSALCRAQADWIIGMNIHAANGAAIAGAGKGSQHNSSTSVVQ
jgi:DNA topoisomerase-3